MKNIIKGLILFATVFGMMTMGILGLVLTGTRIQIDQTNSTFLFWLFGTAFASSTYMIIPMVFRDTFWKNEKQIEEEIKKYHQLQNELRRKIDKL